MRERAHADGTSRTLSVQCVACEAWVEVAPQAQRLVDQHHRSSIGHHSSASEDMRMCKRDHRLGLLWGQPGVSLSARQNALKAGMRMAQE